MRRPPVAALATLALASACGFHPDDPAVPKPLVGVQARALLTTHLFLYVEKMDGSVESLYYEDSSLKPEPSLANAISFVQGSEGDAIVPPGQITTGPMVAGTVVQAAVNAGETCWVLSDGSAGCSQGAAAPLVVAQPGGARAVTRTFAHACVARTDGTVDCYAQADSGTFGPPQRVAGVSGAVALATAADSSSTSDVGLFSCALVDGGQVRCWGDDTFAQLGDGQMHQTDQLVTVAGPDGKPLAGATQIAAKEANACALLGDGTVTCWGGDAFAINTHGAAAKVPKVKGATAVSIGGGLTCALLGDGTVACWGGGHTVEPPGLLLVPLPN